MRVNGGHDPSGSPTKGFDVSDRVASAALVHCSKALTALADDDQLDLQSLRGELQALHSLLEHAKRATPTNAPAHLTLSEVKHELRGRVHFKEQTMDSSNHDSFNHGSVAGESATSCNEDESVSEWLANVLGVSTEPSSSAAAKLSAELCEAAASGNVDALRYLVSELGASPNVGEYDRRTALHLASSEGLLDVVTVLVEELGADVSVVDRWGSTPLDDAERWHHDAVAQFLTSKGAVRNAASTARKGAHPSATNPSATNPYADLCDAAARGDVECLRALVGAGLEVNRGDYDQRTALHLAASEGHVETIRVLIDEFNADCSVQNRWGHTPLDDALRSDRVQASVLLRSKGALRGEMGAASGGIFREHGSLWVLPQQMDLVLSSALCAPMEINEKAERMAAAALVGFDGDVIALDEASGGHALYLIGHTLLSHHGLYEALGLDRATVRRFLLALEATYGVGKYHNSIHGADVALSLHIFLTQFNLLGRLSKLELFAGILGALCHDFNHPGTSNSHEQRVRTQRSIRHSDSSVLERHHLHSTFTLMQHHPFDILDRLPSEDRTTVRSLMIESVLATDLSQHLQYVTRLRTLAAIRGHAIHSKGVGTANAKPWQSPFLDPDEVDIKLLLAIGIKWADLSHATKSLHLHQA
jgi:ankyrin repeat protein